MKKNCIFFRSSKCLFSNEVCADFNFEDYSSTEKLFEISEDKKTVETKFLASAIKYPALVNPDWSHLFETSSISKTDYEEYPRADKQIGTVFYPLHL